VVAAAVGGLRSLVDHANTGFLVDTRNPPDWAAAVSKLLHDDDLRAEMGVSAAARSRRYSWSITAARLRRLYGDLVVRDPVRCS
jgi:D-inositol-3-phosphate glycosyltransferase